MKLLCPAALAAALAFWTTPAYAHPVSHYTGGCEMTVVGDGEDSPSSTWTGEARLDVAATNADGTPSPQSTVAAECHLYVNGFFHSVVVAGSGTGAAAGTNPAVSFQADPDDAVSLCADIDIDGEAHFDCHQPLMTNPSMRSAVVGYISIVHTAGTGAPTYTVHGDLAGPQWSCSATSAAPFTVTCTPTSAVPRVDYACAVLHADVQGLSATAQARTAMDCDGDGFYEAQTEQIEGVDYDNGWATTDATVTSFRCVVAGSGLSPAATPDFRAGCGDPGAVRLRH